MEESEQELLALLASDLHGNFLRVVEHYQHRLYTFALRLTRSFQDAEDIVQEALVGAYVSLENYTPERIRALKLQAWLYRVVFNVYSHSRRNTQLHLVPLTTFEEHPELDPADREEEQPELLCTTWEQQREMEGLVARLPERYRVAITCYYFEQLSYREIAELLAQPIGTVKSTISRGLRLLRASIDAQEQEREEQSWSQRTPRHKNP